MIRGDARPSPPRRRGAGGIVGYSGMWLMVDEAHITTIAVDPAYRSLRALASCSSCALLDRAQDLGAAEATLECRVSNRVAQALYRKYTFRDAGIRKRYYSDDGEDALIMTSEPLASGHSEEVLANRTGASFRAAASARSTPNGLTR